MKRSNTIALTAALGVVALALSACAPSNHAGGAAESKISGSLAGSGASAQEAAQKAWISGAAAKYPGLQVTYNAIGSGAGRKEFLGKKTLFAGSDSLMKASEIEEAKKRCNGDVIELPLYISPIAVVYNLPGAGVKNLNLKPSTIAKIFNGKITSWNDPEIVAANPEAKLGDTPIVPVNRSDKSGTTHNFTDYLQKAAGADWPHEAGEVWPLQGTQSGEGTSGVIKTVTAKEGAIGYADASRAGGLGTVAVGVGDKYVPFSPEAAAKIVDISPADATASDNRLAVALARDSKEDGVYPIVLISYVISCDNYPDEADAARVKAYLEFLASEEGQSLAAKEAGSAPISGDMRTKVNAIVGKISKK